MHGIAETLKTEQLQNIPIYNNISVLMYRILAGAKTNSYSLFFTGA